MNFRVDGEQLLRRQVKAHGNGAAVGIPKAWLHREVAIVLLPKVERSTWQNAI